MTDTGDLASLTAQEIRPGCPILSACEGWGTDASGVRWVTVDDLRVRHSPKETGRRKSSPPSPTLVYDKDGAPAEGVSFINGFPRRDGAFGEQA